MLDEMGTDARLDGDPALGGAAPSEPSHNRLQKLARWAAAALILAGAVPVEILFYLDYRTDTVLSFTMVLAAAFGSAFALSLATLLTDRLLASGATSIFVGGLVLQITYTLPLPWSLVPGVTTILAGLVSFIARFYDPYARSGGGNLA